MVHVYMFCTGWSSSMLIDLAQVDGRTLGMCSCVTMVTVVANTIIVCSHLIAV